MAFPDDPQLWDERLINTLVDDQACESLTLEFKRELSTRRPTDKKEIAKDISGMANADGGWIIYGIEEQSATGAAANIVPLSSAAGVTVIDQISSSAVSPRPRVRVAPIGVTGGYCIVVRTEASWDALHQVCAYGDNRFWRRTEREVAPMSEPEVRLSYERIARLRHDAERDLLNVADQELADGRHAGEWWSLILMPVGCSATLDVATFSATDLARELGGGDLLCGLRPSQRGFESRLPSAGSFHEAGYALRIRRNGVIHMRLASFASERRFPAVAVIKYVRVATRIAERVWPRLGHLGPWRAYTAMRIVEPLRAPSLDPGMPGSSLAPGLREHSIRPAVPQAIQDGQLEKLVLDYFWQAMGESRCDLFSETGELTAEWQR